MPTSQAATWWSRPCSRIRKVKAEAIAKAEAAIGPECIFASNTSTLPITGLADALVAAGAVHRHPLLLAGREDDAGRGDHGQADRRPGARRGARLRARRSGRRRSSSMTARGFYANRCVGNYLREGHLMLDEGVPPAMIENAARMAGMPVGPLSLNDEVAIDLALKIVQGDQGAARRRRRSIPCRRSCWSRWWNKQGRLGRKNGKGFYDYPEKGPKTPVAGPDGPAGPQARPRCARRRGAEAALPGHPGAGGGARPSRTASSPTRARPMSAPSSASASRPSPAGRCPTSTAWARRPSWRYATRSPNARPPLRARRPAARHGRERRDVLRPRSARRRRRREAAHSRTLSCRPGV